MFEVTTDIQKAFFNSREIERKIDAQTRRNLSKAGAAVRREQRDSLKRRKSTSTPGSPPHLHTSNPRYSPKNVLYGYDDRNQTVVIGMVKLPQSTVVGDIAFPEVMERGGTIVVRNKRGKRRRVTIRRRPSSVPAAERASKSGDIIEPWEGSILE